MKQSLDWILLEKCTQCDKENKFFVFVDYILMGENMLIFSFECKHMNLNGCRVFQPAFMCCAHPKAGQNTQRMDPVAVNYTLYFFSSKKQVEFSIQKNGQPLSII